MTDIEQNSTVVAIATAPGEGGIGVVRLSGPRALKIADHIFAARSNLKPSAQKAYTSQYGWILENGGSGARVDEALLLVMRAPKSYTCEDMVEISCHGGRILMQTVVRLCVQAGAVLAEPGEFTRRAFLNGRIDLTQAEAVLDLIRAKSEHAFKASAEQLSGSLSAYIKKVRDDLAHVLSHLEAAIDFPEDKVDPMAHEEMSATLERINSELATIEVRAQSAQMIRDGFKCVLIGEPNVGKSSLMNLLLKRERMLVSDTPGTTRDTVEETIHLGCMALRLVDTAGLAFTTDPLESRGMAYTRQELESAHGVLFLVDGSKPPSASERKQWVALKDQKRLMVINKSDSAHTTYVQAYRALAAQSSCFEVSCLTGAGWDVFERALQDFITVNAGDISTERWLFSVRQARIFQAASQSVYCATQTLRQAQSPELIACDVKRAMDQLGEIVGAVVTDDILDLVFQQFCIGK